ncbi:hypothetical protein AMJ40_00055 [candidate division TA06 bacterium DG_26]|uniref:Septum formation initiator n=1 Tax=candidate division TA06 bacterium DG_26 TaxID=1703771 RepID=A0A0S7WMD9_UNCT6|nr:MAG: hypothetical protein AMJ40_00055 [candidate division TA06 bacterium DG_26]
MKLLHWLYLLIFCGFGWVLLFGDYGLVKIVSAHRLESRMRNEIFELKVRKELLLTRCERLEEDSFLLEILAREKLGMVKPGEKCYRLVQ